jgi:cell division protein FtsZ
MPAQILPLKIKAIAIGNRGCSVIGRLGSLSRKGLERGAISVSGKMFKMLKLKDKVELPRHFNIEHGLDVEKSVKEIMRDKHDEIIKMITGMDAIFLVGSLVSRSTVYQAREITRMCKKMGILVFFVSTTPFLFEGKEKQSLAREMKAVLKDSVDALLIVDNNKIIKQKISMVEACTQMDKIIIGMMDTIIDIVSKYGAINIDFADLKTTVQNVGEAFFNSIVCTRKEIDTITDKLFSQANLVTEPNNLQKVLYVIYAGQGLLLHEVNQIAEKINQKVNNQARIIFGVVNEDKMKNKVKLVLIGG